MTTAIAPVTHPRQRLFVSRFRSEDKKGMLSAAAVRALGHPQRVQTGIRDDGRFVVWPADDGSGYPLYPDRRGTVSCFVAVGALRGAGLPPGRTWLHVEDGMLVSDEVVR